MELLHQDNGQEMTDTEHDTFLDETFVLTDDTDEEEDNMFEAIDMTCDPPRKSEEFSDEAMDLSPIPRAIKVLRFISGIKNDMLIIANTKQLAKLITKLH